MEMKAFDIFDETTGSKARVSLFGATVISWQTAKTEHLFLSEKAILDGTKAIRGGIPPVFPVFGKASEGPCKDLPQHGFARDHLWQLSSKNANTATLRLAPDDLSKSARDSWSYEFELLYTITVGGANLTTRLEIVNKDKKDFEFQTLLHTYFRVNDIANVHVDGLHGVSYADKITSTKLMEKAEHVKCTAETDRVYPQVSQPVHIYENDKVKVILARDGLDDIVLWNPWTGCKNMADFGPEDGYRNMICVEAGSVNKWYKLQAGHQYVAQQTLTARL